SCSCSSPLIKEPRGGKGAEKYRLFGPVPKFSFTARSITPWYQRQKGEHVVYRDVMPDLHSGSNQRSQSGLSL
uniref:Uncharacterized protein n=1 Tax=Oreochromis niloticus TaxID=8128 RepID=A0A669DX28_ORENI